MNTPRQLCALTSGSLHSGVRKGAADKHVTRNKGIADYERHDKFSFLPLQIPYYEIEMLKSKHELVEYLQTKLFSQNADVHC